MLSDKQINQLHHEAQDVLASFRGTNPTSDNHGVKTTQEDVAFYEKFRADLPFMLVEIQMARKLLRKLFKGTMSFTGEINEKELKFINELIAME